MSNLINNFVSKLTKVTHSIAKNGNNVYRGYFEDGTDAVIRTSGRTYKSVAQLWVGKDHSRTDFLFGSKAEPTLTKWERAERHIVTVQIQPA